MVIFKSPCCFTDIHWSTEMIKDKIIWDLRFASKGIGRISRVIDETSPAMSWDSWSKEDYCTVVLSSAIKCDH